MLQLLQASIGLSEVVGRFLETHLFLDFSAFWGQFVCYCLFRTLFVVEEIAVDHLDSVSALF